ncbi:hypothetical protein GCM10020229_28750 [Kitasatospora albolonga]|uniref:DUF6879 family protein n=1 Tax=Kitasatospora albolonga TaxID=68173 RepID=UPI0031E8D45E
MSRNGRHLELDSYREDFRSHFWKSGTEGFWKLERQQHFQEPGVESWEAFRLGDWDRAVELIEEKRGHFQEYFDRIARHGFTVHRVRCVEEPISAYLQWELHWLNLKNQCGEDTTVLTGGKLRHYESEGPLREVVVLGSRVMYEIVYDDLGRLAGGVRFGDAREIAEQRLSIQEMHGAGEPLGEFFDRCVAPLPPPEPFTGGS